MRNRSFVVDIDDLNGGIACPGDSPQLESCHSDQSCADITDVQLPSSPPIDILFSTPIDRADFVDALAAKGIAVENVSYSVSASVVVSGLGGVPADYDVDPSCDACTIRRLRLRSQSASAAGLSDISSVQITTVQGLRRALQPIEGGVAIGIKVTSDDPSDLLVVGSSDTFTSALKAAPSLSTVELAALSGIDAAVIETAQVDMTSAATSEPTFATVISYMTSSSVEFDASSPVFVARALNDIGVVVPPGSVEVGPAAVQSEAVTDPTPTTGGGQPEEYPSWKYEMEVFLESEVPEYSGLLRWLETMDGNVSSTDLDR